MQKYKIIKYKQNNIYFLTLINYKNYMESINQQIQYRILMEIVSLKDSKTSIGLLEYLKGLFIILGTIVQDDWKHYTILEKIIFLGIWSPLLWFPVTLLVEV